MHPLIPALIVLAGLCVVAIGMHCRTVLAGVR